MNEDWKVAYKTTMIHKAEIAKNLLIDEGIETVVLNKKDSLYVVFGSLSIYVQPENLEKAKELLKDMDVYNDEL